MKHRVLVPTCVAALLVAGCLDAGSHEAVAWLRARSNRGPVSGTDAAEYDQYRKTQIQLIKSPLVLTAALRQPGIASLPTLSGQPDPVGWLARAITVAAPAESEVIQVRLRHANAREAVQIVNAVTQAYLSDVVNKERTERLARRDELEKKYKANMAEVRTRLETFNNLAHSLGTRDSAELAKQQSLLLDHLSTLQKQLTQQQREIIAQPLERTLKDLEQTLKEFDRVAKEVIALGKPNADLEARRNEIAQLQAVTNQMGIQLNASEVDIAMPNRVELIEEAQEPKAR